MCSVLAQVYVHEIVICFGSLKCSMLPNMIISCANYLSYYCFCSQGTAPDEAHMISAFGGPGFYIIINHDPLAYSFLLFVSNKILSS